MKTLKEIVDKMHVGYNEVADYHSIVRQRELTDEDIVFIRESLEEATSSNCGYSLFPDAGGIDICFYLLEEVLKLKEKL